MEAIGEHPFPVHHKVLKVKISENRMSTHANRTRNNIPMGYMMLVEEVQPLQIKLISTLLDNFENNLHKKAGESTQGLLRWCQTLGKRTYEGEA